MRITGISFDHMHMGDLLGMVHNHPGAEIAGIFDPDPARMTATAQALNIPSSRIFTDFDTCMAATKPDLTILCAAPADHASYTERLAQHATHRNGQLLPFFGQRDVARVADEERETDHFLEVFDLLADRRRRLVQLERGQFETAPARRAIEVEQP